MFQTAVLELKEVQKSEKTLDKHLFSFLDQYKTLRWRRRSDSFGIRFTHSLSKKANCAHITGDSAPCWWHHMWGWGRRRAGGRRPPPSPSESRPPHTSPPAGRHGGQSRSEPPRQQTSHLNFYSLTPMNTSRSFTGSMPAAASRCLRKSMKTKYFWGVLNIFIFSRNQRSTDRKSDRTERRTDMLETN